MSEPTDPTELPDENDYAFASFPPVEEIPQPPTATALPEITADMKPLPPCPKQLALAQPKLPDIDFPLTAALNVIAEQKGLRLAQRADKIHPDGDRYIPLYGPEDIGEPMYRKLLKMYRDGVDIGVMVKRLQQQRLSTNQNTLTMLDIYACLRMALLKNEVVQRHVRGEFGINAFARFFHYWKTRTQTRDIRRKLGQDMPSEAVFAQALRALKSRYTVYGSVIPVQPVVEVDIPLVEMLRYAERHVLQGSVCMVIPVHRLPFDLKKLLAELYCFKGKGDREFSIRNEVLEAMQAAVKPEHQERLARKEKMAETMASVPVTPAEPPKNQAMRVMELDLDPHGEPLAAASPLVVEAIEKKKPETIAQGMRFRGGGFERIDQKTENDDLPTPPLPLPPELPTVQIDDIHDLFDNDMEGEIDP